jgi:hypothetical protein
LHSQGEKVALSTLVVFVKASWRRRVSRVRPVVADFAGIIAVYLVQFIKEADEGHLLLELAPFSTS